MRYFRQQFNVYASDMMRSVCSHLLKNALVASQVEIKVLLTYDQKKKVDAPPTGAQLLVVDK
jgi:hypothetical protein